nr:nuclear envelope morphology protein 1 [Quercus suber]
MNSLNIVSRLTATPPSTPPRSRTSSVAQINPLSSKQSELDLVSEKLEGEDSKTESEDGEFTERTPLLESSGSSGGMKSRPGYLIWEMPRRVAHALLSGVTVIFTALTAPARYVIASFYDAEGHFSTVMPLRSLKALFGHRRRRVGHSADSGSESKFGTQEEKRPTQRRTTPHRKSSIEDNASSTSAASSEGEIDDTPAKRTRSKTAAAQQNGDGAQVKKSGRVQLLHNDEALRKRKSQRAQHKKSADPSDIAKVAGSLKSPSSPANAAKLTRYPRAPAPPRPLVPRRQASYTTQPFLADAPKKTLIIDLDETLIHSMSKGGRMSTGHMVEVRLSGPVSASGAQIGPGIPILYYVHERPGCHEFLRKVCKWYKLIVFTASVQEYADPVIDWVEREHKYFSGRYYRQHCTFRNGAYIKDLAQVEADLSQVMILDNSPMSYIFHEGEQRVELRITYHWC